MEDGLTQYQIEIERYPTLSAAQEQDLAERMATGDAAARECLINAHLRLAVNLAKKYHPRYDDLLDIIQEANIGLIKAADKFDPTKGRFAIYAAWWIEERIIMVLAHPHDTLSLDDETNLLQETLQDDSPQPEEAVHLQQLNSHLYATFACLTQQERLALVLRYGLDGHGKNRTLIQVGSKLKISPERTGKLIGQAIQKIRKSGHSAALRDYWEERTA